MVQAAARCRCPGAGARRIEAANREARLAQGNPLDAGSWQAICAAARDVGLSESHRPLPPSRLAAFYPAERLTSALCVIDSDEVMLPSSISFHFSIQIKSLNQVRDLHSATGLRLHHHQAIPRSLPVGPGATAILSSLLTGLLPMKNHERVPLLRGGLQT